MKLSKCFTSFVGISLSIVVVSKRFICCDISFAVIGSKGNSLLLSTVDTVFLMIEILG